MGLDKMDKQNQASVLDDRESKFVDVYVATLNASEAYRQSHNYTGNNVGQYGCEFMKKPSVRAAIDERLKAVHMGANEVLARLAQHATATARDYVNEDGILDLRSERAKSREHLIKKVRVRTQRNDDTGDLDIVESSVETYDAQAALVHLGRHHKLFTDKIQIDDSQYKLYLEKLGQFLSPGSHPPALLQSTVTQDAVTQDGEPHKIDLVTQDELHKILDSSDDEAVT